MFEFEIQKIPDNESREYLKEVISSYENKNYRSAIVMLYAAVMANIIDKLDYLDKNYKDKAAKDILKDIQDNKKNYVPSKETKMIKKIEENMPDFLSKQAFATIEGLKNWRNLCAHPNLDSNSLSRLQEPSMEIVSGLIRESLDNIFIQQAHPNGKIVEHLVTELASKSDALLINDEETLTDFLKLKYFVEIDNNDKIYIYVLKNIFKFTFCIDDIDCNKNRNILYKTLAIMIDHKPDLTKKYFQESSNLFKNVLVNSPDVFEKLSLLFQRYPELYSSNVPKFLKENLVKFSYKDPITYLKNYFIDSNSIAQHQNKLLSSSDKVYTSMYGSSRADNMDKITLAEYFFELINCYIPNMQKNDLINYTNEVQKLYNIYSRSGYSHQFFELANIIYAHSSSYDSANNIFTSWIAPFLEKYDKTAIEDLIQKADNNSQCYERRFASVDHFSVFQTYNKLLDTSLSIEEFKNRYPRFANYYDTWKNSLL